VQSEIDGVKNQRAWAWTKGCVEVNGKANRDFCQQFHSLSAELASAQQSGALQTRVDALKVQLNKSEGTTVMSEADPQAAVLSKLASFLGLNFKIEDVQTALTIFVALLLEVGSGFGMYVAFSQWRLYDSKAPDVPQMVPSVQTATAVPVATSSVLLAQKPASIANDNRSTPAQKLVAPENDVERFRKDRIETTEGSSLTATALYEDYCAWCEDHQKEPLALPTFGREFGELGVQKAKIAGRVRYIGVSLKPLETIEEDKKLTGPASAAA
jgi:hypothetical protein